MSQSPAKTDVDFYKKAERPKHDKGNVSVQIHQALNASVTWGQESKDVEVTDCPINVAIGNPNAAATPASALSFAEGTPVGETSQEGTATAELAQNTAPPAVAPSAVQTMRERLAAAAASRIARNTPAQIVTLADITPREEEAGARGSSDTAGRVA
ncbi:unnamed protein product [Cyclocybe aegerita]|uniref:Uncharacterized protein n=1 Tax=Cyclocybe aegerita TaxID=1973307 RepID=A0A8S0WSE1_CYCAE|nr:unnamed protein product [Cyclocybe aegerita]